MNASYILVFVSLLFASSRARRRLEVTTHAQSASSEWHRQTRSVPVFSSQALSAALLANVGSFRRADKPRLSITRMSKAGMSDRKAFALSLLSDQSLVVSQSRRKIIASSIATAILIAPTVAEATYGSARGAVTSLPEVRDFSFESFQRLDPRKQAQVESILRPTQIEALLQELAVQKNILQNRIESTMQSSLERSAKLKEIQEKKQQMLSEFRATKSELEGLEKKIEQVQRKTEDVKKQIKGEQAEVAGKVSKQKQILLEKEVREEKKLVDLQSSLVIELDSKRIALEKAEKLEVAQVTLINEEAAKEEDIKRANADLQRTLKLQERVKKREKIVSALEDQPDWFNYVAAGLASCVSTLIMHPVDTLKTRQILEAGVKLDGETETTNNTVEVSPMKSVADSGAIDPISTSASNASANSEQLSAWDINDFLSLYQGLPGALLKEGPPSALYLGIYEGVKSLLLAYPFFQANPLLAYLIAGGIGETGGSVIRAPAEQLKTRVQSGMDASITESIQKVLLEDSGRENAVRSWTASVWRDVPFGAVQLAIYESLKSYIVNSPQSFLDIDVNALSTEIVLGACGGGIGSFISTPMDVVTTRIMTQDGTSGKLGFADMTKKVWEEGGWRALFTGSRARVTYWAPAIGIFLSCYCTIREAAIAQGLFDNIPG